MSRLGLMVDRYMNPQKIVALVDLGNIKDRRSRDCADRLMAAGCSRKNFSIEGNGRLLVNLPPMKAPALIKRFRFEEGPTYWQCTHHRRGLVG